MMYPPWHCKMKTQASIWPRTGFPVEWGAVDGHRWLINRELWGAEINGRKSLGFTGGYDARRSGLMVGAHLVDYLFGRVSLVSRKQSNISSRCVYVEDALATPQTIHN